MENKKFFSVECRVRYKEFSCTLSIQGDRTDVLHLARLANRSFYEVEISDLETGEVLYSRYTSPEIFVQSKEIPTTFREIFNEFTVY